PLPWPEAFFGASRSRRWLRVCGRAPPRETPAGGSRTRRADAARFPPPATGGPPPLPGRLPPPPDPRPAEAPEQALPAAARTDRADAPAGAFRGRMPALSEADLPLLESWRMGR